MSFAETDQHFTAPLPKVYERYLVPLIFAPYATDLARRLEAMPCSRLLEVAAGTGVATRALAAVLPGEVEIVATDRNPPMLAEASSIPTTRPVDWRQADAMQLPFDDASFDVLVCQFGVMFFPNKPRAFAEARRVLKPGGVFVFNVWDGIEHNEFADVVTAAVAAVFPGDPPRFLARTPHGYGDPDTIRRDLADGGFVRAPEIVTTSARSQAASHRAPAIGYCLGTPLRDEIVARDASRLAEATDVAAEVIAARFGRGPIDGKIQAHVVTIQN